jgi:hypothetical protein
MTELTGEAGAPALAPTHLSSLIDAWFAEHFHGHPSLRDTETFNHIRRAVDDLKQRLATPE